MQENFYVDGQISTAARRHTIVYVLINAVILLLLLKANRFSFPETLIILFGEGMLMVITGVFLFLLEGSDPGYVGPETLFADVDPGDEETSWQNLDEMESGTGRGKATGGSNEEVIQEGIAMNQELDTAHLLVESDGEKMTSRSDEQSVHSKSEAHQECDAQSIDCAKGNPAIRSDEQANHERVHSHEQYGNISSESDRVETTTTMGSGEEPFQKQIHEHQQVGTLAIESGRAKVTTQSDSEASQHQIQLKEQPTTLSRNTEEKLPGTREGGASSSENGQDGEYCTKCDQRKPLRAHHCDICKKYVHGFSHHSGWLRTCIGEKNSKLTRFRGSLELNPSSILRMIWVAFKEALHLELTTDAGPDLLSKNLDNHRHIVK